MSGRARIMIVLASELVALAAVAPLASAKGDQPFRVVTPSGTVFWVRGAAAQAWWRDLTHARSCMCLSPTDSARWAQQVAQAWGNQPPRPYVLEPQIGLVTLVYPASGRAPAYGLTPDALGSTKQDWNMWFFPTKQMLGTLASGSTADANRAAAQPAISSSTSGETWTLVALGVAAMACGTLIAIPRTRRLAGRALTARH